jgi:predicted nucleic acid-binding Zn ribbon protein
MPIDLDGVQVQEYNRIQIQCSKNCTQIISLGILNEHLSVCGLENCTNFEKCKSFGKFIIGGEKYCSEFCYLFRQAETKKIKNKVMIFDLIKKYKLLKNKMIINFFDSEKDFMEDGYLLEE